MPEHRVFTRAQPVARLERVVEFEVLLQVARQQEVLPHSLLGEPSHPLAQRLVFKELDDPSRRLLRRRDEEAI